MDNTKTVTITKMNKTPRTSKRTGKAFTSLGLLTQEYGERWLSGFAGKENEHWKEGDKVEIIVEEKGEYLNFSLPKHADRGPAASNAATAELKNMLTFKVIPMLQQIDSIVKAIAEQKGVNLTGIVKAGYPEMTESNDGSGI